MVKVKNKIGLIVAGAYIALAVLANAYTWFVGSLGSETSEFAGLTLILLGLPWSIAFKDFNPVFLRDTYNNSILVEDMFILLNTILLYVAAAIAARAFRRE